jgi:hypothetical protein
VLVRKPNSDSSDNWIGTRKDADCSDGVARRASD